MEGGENVKISQYRNDVRVMKLATQIKRDQLDIFITKTITLMTLSPATTISPYLSVLM